VGLRVVSGDLVDVYGFALFAMLNPSLIAGVTVMLLFPDPKRLIFGYLLGPYLTSITLAPVIVFALPGSSTDTTAKTVAPAEDLVVKTLDEVDLDALSKGRLAVGAAPGAEMAGCQQRGRHWSVLTRQDFDVPGRLSPTSTE
jgi:hypothetical protein